MNGIGRLVAGGLAVVAVAASAPPGWAGGPSAPAWLDVLASAQNPPPATEPATQERPLAPPPHAPPPTEVPWLRVPAFCPEGLQHYLECEEDFEARAHADYAVRSYLDGVTTGPGDRIGFTQHYIGARVGNYGSAMITARGRALHFHRRPRLPDTGERFPCALWDVQLGSSVLALPLMGLLDVTFGSASDVPFASGDEMTADVTWITGTVPIEEGFIFFVNYSNNRDYLNRCTLPGFEFRLRGDSAFQMVAGFPFSGFRWEPFKTVSLKATYSYPRTVHAEGAWLPVRELKFYAGFDWENQRYYLHDRDRRDDRLWYVEKRLTGGVRWAIAKDIYLDLSGGLAFDRFFFEGETYEDRGRNRLDIHDGPFLGMQLGIRF